MPCFASKYDFITICKTSNKLSHTSIFYNINSCSLLSFFWPIGGPKRNAQKCLRVEIFGMMETCKIMFWTLKNAFEAHWCKRCKKQCFQTVHFLFFMCGNFLYTESVLKRKTCDVASFHFSKYFYPNHFRVFLLGPPINQKTAIEKKEFIS